MPHTTEAQGIYIASLLSCLQPQLWQASSFVLFSGLDQVEMLAGYQSYRLSGSFASWKGSEQNGHFPSKPKIIAISPTALEILGCGEQVQLLWVH